MSGKADKARAATNRRPDSTPAGAAAAPPAESSAADPGPEAAAAARPCRALDLERRIRDLAARQHGVVTRAQLLEAGLPGHAIDRRLAKGRIQRVQRGVYRVGLLPLAREREMAALLSCGESAVLSHGSAGALWGFLPEVAPGAPGEVSVWQGHPSPPGVRVHRVTCLPAEEVVLVEGMPVTTPARTLVDLAGQLEPRALEQALAQAERLGLVARTEVAKVAARHPGHSGAAALRAQLAAGNEPAFTRSEAEARFLALVRRAQLSAPASNTSIRGCEVDFAWRSEHLVVEIDGFAFHSSAAAFERDRRRDAMLAAAGFRVLRVTWRQLSREPEAVLARVAQALVARAPAT